MDTHDIVEAWRRGAFQEGIERGYKATMIDGYEARFGPMSSELRAAVEETHDMPALRTWVRLMVTRSADEFAAKLGRSRPS